MSFSLPAIRLPVANPFIGQKERQYASECFDKNQLGPEGEFVELFEKAFAQRFGGGTAVAICNGTLSIDIALKALGLEPADEVMVPNFTFVGSVSPIYRLRAVPILIPTATSSWQMDVKKLENYLSPRTKAIVAVHLYGVPCDMEAIMDFANRHGLVVVEDCAESLGASIKGRAVGTFGHIASYSFFGNKVLTTGEGGMCLTHDPKLAEKMKILRDNGLDQHCPQGCYQAIGYSGQMTNLQAAIGLGQTQSIEEILNLRAEIHKAYQQHFSDKAYFFHPQEPEGASSVCWLESPVLAPNLGLDREQLLQDLRSEGIETRPFFYPVSTMPAFSRFGITDAQSEFFSSHGFNLPTYTTLSVEDAHHIGQRVCFYIEQQLEKNPPAITLPARYPADNHAASTPAVSIILPTYNEAGHIKELIHLLRQQMVLAQQNYEILVIDDNSPDNTAHIAQEAFNRDPRVRVINRKERGLASALLEGIKQSKGRLLLIMDSDFRHDPAQARALVIGALYYDIVSGSRFTAGGACSDPIQGQMAGIYNLLLRALLRLPTRDNLMGYFCIHRKKLLEMDLATIFHGEGDYFFRLLYAARRLHYSILEIPVRSGKAFYGRASRPFFQSLLRYTKEALKLRIRRWFNRL